MGCPTFFLEGGEGNPKHSFAQSVSPHKKWAMLGCFRARGEEQKKSIIVITENFEFPNSNCRSHISTPSLHPVTGWLAGGQSELTLSVPANSGAAAAVGVARDDRRMISWLTSSSRPGWGWSGPARASPHKEKTLLPTSERESPTTNGGMPHGSSAGT